MSDTRERILDAYEEMLVSQGERSATLEALADAAGLSKGGLLYHFGSKSALVDGLIARMLESSAADVARMVEAPAGAVDYFLRSSRSPDAREGRTSMAANALMLAGETQVLQAVRECEDAWEGALRDHVADPVTARMIKLVGDGLYFGAVLTVSGEEPIDDATSDAELEAMIARLVEASAQH